jgi:hypothetical protein
LRSRYLTPVLALGLLAAALPLGCQHDEITEYDVPKEEPKVRLLGAILPHDNDVWYFKLVGPMAVVAEQKDDFDRFVRSVAFPGEDGKPVKWVVPQGWQEQPGRELRYATFKLGPKDSPLELTVTRFDNKGKAADIPENVNRWRKNDLGLRAPVPQEDLPALIREEKFAGTTVTFVDATGPGTPQGARPMMGPMEQPGMERPGPARGAKPAFKYDTPEGWKEFDAGRGMVPIDLAFRIADKDTGQPAQMTVSTAGGDLEQNVIRWARQIEIPRFDAADAKKAMRDGTVDGLPAQLVDLEGPADQGAGRQRILGAIVKRDGVQWFFKLKGPHGVVSRQQDNFEKFLKSFHFGGGR